MPSIHLIEACVVYKEVKVTCVLTDRYTYIYIYMHGKAKIVEFDSVLLISPECSAVSAYPCDDGKLNFGNSLSHTSKKIDKIP